MLRAVLISRTVLPNCTQSQQCSVRLQNLNYRNYSLCLSSSNNSLAKSRTLFLPSTLPKLTNPLLQLSLGTRSLSSTVVTFTSPTIEAGTSTFNASAVDTGGAMLNTAAVDTGGAVLTQVLTEPTFQSLGLAHWWFPSGWLQYLMEQIYLNFDIPWWGAIMISKSRNCDIYRQSPIFSSVTKNIF